MTWDGKERRSVKNRRIFHCVWRDGYGIDHDKRKQYDRRDQKPKKTVEQYQQHLMIQFGVKLSSQVAEETVKFFQDGK